jgi:Tol biopolymer transport system component
MALTAGTRLGPYEILERIGAGGMGEVYRAQDTRLDRTVAIKILPAAVAQDAERLARFDREAKVLASLNHPNIAHVYGLEEDGQMRALVMELVPGSTLAAPLPLQTALDYARQIAVALEAAHEKGITHRDLKPANIMVTPDGTVKVLDFGLASAPNRESTSDPANSPTITMAATQVGVILGTAAYMSPEQASGKTVDKRSDIWSFGVVLYEMLTGAKLFVGETISHTLAHVLTQPIDFAKLPKGIPPTIETLLRRCLDREVKTRLRDIGEARIAIERYLADPAPAAAAAPGALAPRVRWVAPWLIAGIALALAAGLAWQQFRQPVPAEHAVRFTVPVPPKMTVSLFNTMALSPDGRYLAYTVTAGANSATSQLWLRPLDSTESRPLAGTDGARSIFWSPDSRFIGFGTTEGLRKVAVEGGPPVSVSKAGHMGGTWNRQGIILIGNYNGPIAQVAEGGGNEKAVLTLDKSRRETGQTWPQFLPDGRHFLYLSRAGEQPGIYLATLGSSEIRKLVTSEAQARYAQGYLLFPSGGQTLMAQPFDASAGKITGTFFPVAERVGIMPEVGVSLFSTSENGSLAFRQVSSSISMIAIFNRRGDRVGTAGPPGDYAQITLSPDEKRIAIDRRENGNYDIWMLELASGVFSRITFDPGNDRDPVFSADGRQMVFTNDRLGMPHLYRKTIGGGPEELIYKGPDREASEAWLKDGSILFGNLRGLKYFLLRPGEAAPKLIYQSEFTVDEPAISPDGSWVAYGSTESGRWEAYMARFPQWDERRQISTDGGMEPHWRGDGREIVYLAPEGKLMSVEVKRGASLETGSPATLFNSGLRGSGSVEQWTMSRDASKFYVLSSLQEGDRPITVVLNWLPQPRRNN